MIKQSGLTLVELMVTVTVLVIVTTAAVPNFRNFIQNNRMAAAVHRFVTSANLARSEAVKRGQRVTVCKSTDLIVCSASGGWDQGWIVFVDENDNGKRDAPGEELLRAQNTVPGNIRMQGQADVSDLLSYNAFGFPTLVGGANLDSNKSTLIMCDARDYGEYARAVVISASGNVRSTSATDPSLNANILSAKTCDL